MGQTTAAKKIMGAFGKTASELDADLRDFRRSARALSNSSPRLIDTYPQQWVGVYRGKVRVHGRTLD